MKSNFPERQYIGRDAILRVRDKLLISNMIPQLWADYRVWFFAKRLFFMFLFLISFTIRLQCIIYTQDFSTKVKIWGNGRGCVGGLTQPLMDFFNGGGNVLVEVEHVVEEVVHGLEATEVVCHLCHPVVAVEIRFVEVGYHDVFLHLQVFCHGI